MTIFDDNLLQNFKFTVIFLNFLENFRFLKFSYFLKLFRSLESFCDLRIDIRDTDHISDNCEQQYGQSLLPRNYEGHWTAFAILAMFGSPVWLVIIFKTYRLVFTDSHVHYYVRLDLYFGICTFIFGFVLCTRAGAIWLVCCAGPKHQACPSFQVPYPHPLKLLKFMAIRLFVTWQFKCSDGTLAWCWLFSAKTSSSY